MATDLIVKNLAGFPLKVPERIIQTMPPPQTHLQAIGGGLQVSSFQEGMEKDYMQYALPEPSGIPA